MTSRRRIDRNLFGILVGGFGLAILSLVASGYLGVRAMERVELRAAALLAEQQFSNRLIDEIQGEEAGLSTIFYQLVTAPETDRAVLRRRLATIELGVHDTLEEAIRSSHAGQADRWHAVQTAVSAFIEEVRRLLENGPEVPAGEEIYRHHEELVSELSKLVASNYENAIRAQQAELERTQAWFRGALVLLGVALLLALVCAILTVWMTSRIFSRMNWQARELSRLSTHVLETQESTVRRFSRELHDELGQTMAAIEANLAAVPVDSEEQVARIEDCRALTGDAISKIRGLSQLLRPSMLDDFGLGPSLQWLADSFLPRSGVDVRASILFEGRLPEAVETHLFRVAQEALTNIARHSGATAVEITFQQQGRLLELVIRDNGRGFSAETKQKQRQGFGLIGMRERINSIGGEIDIRSTPEGVTIKVEVPHEPVSQDQAHSSIASR